MSGAIDMFVKTGEDGSDWQEKERVFLERAAVIRSAPEIGNALEELAKLAERLAKDGIPAWQIANVFHEELRKSRFQTLVCARDGD